MGFLDFLGSALANLGRSLHPRELRRFAAELPVLGPLAVRSLRRRWLRQFLVALSLAAGIMVYITLAASAQGAAADFTGRVEPLALPADIIALFRSTSPDDLGRLLETLEWRASIAEVEVFHRLEAATSAGRRPVIGLEAGSRLWPEPVSGTLPPAGQVLVPQYLGDAVAPAEPGQWPGPGGRFEVGQMTRYGFSGQSFPVAGTFAVDDDLLAEAVLMPMVTFTALGDLLGAGSAAGGSAAVGPSEMLTGLAVRVRSGSNVADAVRDLERLLPGATLLWSGTSSDFGSRLIGGFLSPNAVILGLVFALAGLAVFNVMLLSLLQRKTQIGALKALGFDDDAVFRLLVVEGGLTALGGALLGLTGGVMLVRALNATADMPLYLAPASLAWAVVLAVGAFYLATWLPATLCRRAMPIQLMVGRRLYLNPRSTCAQCGRCGGF